MFFTIIIAVFIALAAEPKLEMVHDASFNPSLLLIYTILVVALSPVPGIILSAGIKPERLRDASGRARVLKRVRIWSVLYQVYLLGSFLLITYVIDWPLLTEGVLGMHRWVLIDELLRLLPFLVMLVLAWMPLYRVDRMLRRGVWSMREYIEFHFRQYVLFILMPFVVMVTVVDILVLLPGGDWLARTGLDYIVAASAMAGLYVMSPLILRHLWKTRRMPEGALRRRLHDLCKRAGMGCRDILVWETMGGHVVNACVAGIIARVRYVMVTDALMGSLSTDEIESVFAHEIGHVKRRHMVYYILFAIAFIALFAILGSTPLFSGLEPAEGANGTWEDALSFGGLALVGLGALYWGVGFAFVSRRMEAEADAYAVELTGSTENFVNALERISFFGGRARTAGSWRHFSIARRTGFLLACRADPQRLMRFKAGMSLMRWGIVSLAVVSVTAVAVRLVM